MLLSPKYTFSGSTSNEPPESLLVTDSSTAVTWSYEIRIELLRIDPAKANVLKFWEDYKNLVV